MDDAIRFVRYSLIFLVIGFVLNAMRRVLLAFGAVCVLSVYGLMHWHGIYFDRTLYSIVSLLG